METNVYTGKGYVRKETGRDGKRLVSYLLLFCLSQWVGIAAAQQEEKEKAAVVAAEQWLSLVDSGGYPESWREAAGYFRNAITEEEWDRSLKAVRSPLGKRLSRRVKSTNYATSLPGAPDGEYVVIQFETSFENKASAIETVTPMFEQGRGWRVSGYYIK